MYPEMTIRTFPEGYTEREKVLHDSLFAALTAKEAAEGALCRAREAGEGAARIVAERVRQKSVEGWTPGHDVHHYKGELSLAAASYAINKIDVRGSWEQNASNDLFPETWNPDWDKRGKHSRERSLEIAGALIAAELDRIAELCRRAEGGK